ncbi:hypothetical protein JM654_07415 [Microbacterium oxydans]|nr:hypothetical protein [Microbacterium oxydans]
MIKDLRIGIDVGGTNTDAVVVDNQGGGRRSNQGSHDPGPLRRNPRCAGAGPRRS